MSNHLVQKWWARREERLCPHYESAELFQHRSHALMPVICPTGQIFVSGAITNDVAQKNRLPDGPDFVWSGLSSPIAKNFAVPRRPKSLL